MLAYVDHGGSGAPLVLLHAFPLSSVMWERVVPLLAPRWRVVTVDLPGLGASKVPVSEPSMAGVAEMIAGVLDAVEVASATVFGVSTGGYAALALAALRPARVDALVLGSTTTRLIEPDEPSARMETAADVSSSGSTEPVAESADEGLSPTAHREQPSLVTMLRSLIASTDPAGVAWMARAIASRSDTGEVLSAFDGNVLLLFGEEDEATPPERGLEMLALRQGSPGTTSYVVLPRVGHLTALEAPSKVAEQLAAWSST